MFWSKQSIIQLIVRIINKRKQWKRWKNNVFNIIELIDRNLIYGLKKSKQLNSKLIIRYVKRKKQRI